MFFSICFWLIVSISSVFSGNLEIYINEMTAEMTDHAIKVALETTGILTDSKDIVRKISEDFDKKYGGKWQCLISPGEVSVNFAHESGKFISFKMLSSYIVLFKISENVVENCKNETSLEDKALSCTYDEKCSLRMMEKAISKVESTPAGNSNFQIDGDSPGKIVPTSGNGGAKDPIPFTHSIVVDCIKSTHLSSFNTTKTFFFKLNSCVRNSFEEKVNEKGWVCVSGINNIFGSDPNKYFVELDYYPLVISLYK